MLRCQHRAGVANLKSGVAAENFGSRLARVRSLVGIEIKRYRVSNPSGLSTHIVDRRKSVGIENGREIADIDGLSAAIYGSTAMKGPQRFNRDGFARSLSGLPPQN